MKEILLILGGSEHEVFIVKHAKKLGYYTIVTDIYDSTTSPAKLEADETWNISWMDFEVLKKACVDRGVGGIIAGFSEFRVESLITLTKELKMPCYCSMEQLDMTRNKNRFKSVCRLYDLPVVPEFELGKISDCDFPVIVKPVDRGGSIGISIAYNFAELKKSVEYAMGKSGSQRIIVEKYLRDEFSKFDVYYYLIHGDLFFICSSDTVMCEQKIGAEILQKAWIYPSKYESLYLTKYDEKIKRMIKGVGMREGYITISAFTNGIDFYFFETGYRLSGDHSFDFGKITIGVDYLDMMIDYSMGKDISKYLPSKERKHSHAITTNYFGKEGYLDVIEGENHLHSLKQVKTYLQFEREKHDVIQKGPMHPYMAMITVADSNLKSLVNILQDIENTFDMKDSSGNSLIYERFDVKSLIQYYD